jgi:hypothetical protein
MIMKKLILCLLLIVGVSFAGDINQKYSFKDFTHHKFVKVDPKEFNDTVIVGSCFYQEGDPDQKVFPDGMKGVTFKRCNLDNVLIPEGNTVDKDCTTKRIKVQNDLRDWILDKDNKPVEVMGKEIWESKGLSIDPAEIPATKLNDIKDIPKVVVK